MDINSVMASVLGGGSTLDMISEFFSHRSAVLFTAVILELALPIPQSCRLQALSPIFRAMADKVNLPSNTRGQSYFAGAMMTAIIIGTVWILLLLLHLITGFDSILSLVILPFLLDSESATRCALRTKSALMRNDKERARKALSDFCQRNTENLSAMGISKAACEYSAMSITSAWLGVIVWYEILGLEGAAAMALLNTLVRTFPVKFGEYSSFGSAILRIYEAFLIAPCVILTLTLLLSFSPVRGFKRAVRGALDYPASVSGYILGLFGGCANISMGGPRVYREQMTRFPRVGGQQQPDERSALKITRRGCFVGLVFSCACMVFSLAL